jgi:hypothetical protein
MSGKEPGDEGSKTSGLTRRRAFVALGAASGSALVPVDLTQDTVAAASGDDELLRTIDVDTGGFDGLEDGTVEIYASGRTVTRFSGTLGHAEDGYSYGFQLETGSDEADEPTTDTVDVSVERLDAPRRTNVSGTGFTAGTGIGGSAPSGTTFHHNDSDDEGDYEGGIYVQGWDCCERQVQNAQAIRWEREYSPDWVEKSNTWAYRNDTEYDWRRNDSRSNYRIHFFDDHIEGADTDEFVDQRDNNVEVHIETYLRGEGSSGDMSWDVVYDRPNWEWGHKVKVYSDAQHSGMERVYR